MSVSTSYYIYTLADGLQPLENQWFVLRSVTFIYLTASAYLPIHVYLLSDCLHLFTDIYFGLALIIVIHVPLTCTH